MKKLIGLGISAMLFVSMFSMTAFATEQTTKDRPADVTVTYFESGFIGVTTEVGSRFEAEPYGSIEKESIQRFQHKINYGSGGMMATVYTEVIGWFSEADRWSEMSSVDVYRISGSQADNFSYDSSVRGNKAYVDMYFNGMHAGTFKYEIQNNDRINNI